MKTTKSSKPTIPTKVECIKSGYIEHPTDCSKYYICLARINGIFDVFEMVCEGDTIWDREKQTCSHPGKVRNSRCGSYTTGKIKNVK